MIDRPVSSLPLASYVRAVNWTVFPATTDALEGDTVTRATVDVGVVAGSQAITSQKYSAWLTTGALLVEVVVTRLSTTGLPEVAVSWVRIQLVQAAVVFVLALVKFAVTGHYAWGSWVGLVLAAVLAYSVWAAAGQPTPANWGEMRSG